MKNIRKPPIAIQVVDLINLARLGMSRTDVQPLFWAFPIRDKKIIGHLSSIPYWRGNLPIFAYTYLDEEPRGYVAYTSLGKEEAFFTTSSDDTRYFYGPVVETEEEPELIAKAIRRRRQLMEKPLMIKAKDLNSLMRVLVMVSDASVSPPLWHYVKDNKHILGIIVPFFDYYEANALPVFFYIESKESPKYPFIRYLSSNSVEEVSYTQYISDMKYFYGKIVTVVSMPLIESSQK
ncbi:MAG: hypothetical protein NZ929_01975 [Aigarchaeota archaeon]|nr:hypothetical protein [Aigarchaeota archaeon]MDW7985812.1 hypothetical protein [Nitrososphaerota archaeon]